MTVLKKVFFVYTFDIIVSTDASPETELLNIVSDFYVAGKEFDFAVLWEQPFGVCFIIYHFNERRTHIYTSHS